MSEIKLYSIDVGLKKVKIHVNNYIETNFKTIEFINTDYFDDLQKILSTDQLNNKYIYYSLFSTYYASLEIMFSHLCAFLQAPHFYYPWILSYTNKQLLNIIQIINNKGNLPNMHNLSKVTWTSISDLMVTEEMDMDSKNRMNLFSGIWEKLAKDFVNADYIEAYNSIKHGLRVKVDAVKQVGIGSMVLTGSDYGISYGKIDSKDGKRIVKSKIVNIDLKAIEYGIEFIRGTMINIKSFLLLSNRPGKTEVNIYFPKTEIVTEYLDLDPPTITSFTSII